MSAIVPLWTLGAELLKAAGNIVGIRSGTEEPQYSSRPLTASVQIRQYSSRVAAETTVLADDDQARSEGFRRLAGYIFGKNQRQAKISMTAPVAQQSDTIAMTAPVSQLSSPTGGSIIRFYMPAKWTLASLPTPGDESIRLTEVPAETLAVLRFSGDRSAAAVAKRTDELLNTLRDSNIKTSGDPQAWFYDPPWTLSCARRNEIAVPIHAQSDDTF
ncbi:heme-binding protein [Mycobacteroides chelonae]|uniref:SOUL family heme-binding protein n=1 Tax=Mycobacteroides chelonae TaxID=1774 RepID=UPI0008A96FAE|nr:heme-binding protein [Mycobacteroides chelonae]MBF9350328.1 heme-binding protein [Mycobacteroides chelonae]OHU40948.1 heme-binding protein [Mycobacteroides chelonae]